MLNLEMNRFGMGLNSTLGHLSVGDFQCFTLEDERRLTKVKAETAIREGSYRILLRDDGGMNQDYQDRFPELHRGMLHLQDVPEFEWIYLHILNTEKQTKGCIGPGTVPVILPNGEFKIADSTTAYLALYRLLLPALLRDEKVIIHINDRQPWP